MLQLQGVLSWPQHLKPTTYPLYSLPAFLMFVTLVCGTEVWTKSLALARQAFYHLSYTPRLFWF
jgi:hypothetical protein